VRKDLIVEIKRKVLHLFAIFIPLFVIYLSTELSFLLLLFTVAIAITLDKVRNKDILISRLYNRFFATMLRDHEKNGSLTGATYFFISLLLSFLFYYLFLGLDIRIVAIAYIAFMLADAAAALVGKFFGKIKIYKSKTLEGLLACFIVSFLIGFPVLNSNLLLLAVFSASIALLELFIDQLDDNLVVPFITLGIIKVLL